MVSFPPACVEASCVDDMYGVRRGGDDNVGVEEVKCRCLCEGVHLCVGGCVCVGVCVCHPRWVLTDRQVNRQVGL